MDDDQVVVMFQLRNNLDKEEWPEVAGVFGNEIQADSWIAGHKRIMGIDKFKYHIEQMWVVPR